MKDTFGGWLERSREARGLSVRLLAGKANISHATISNLEAGKVGASPRMVKALADALKVDAGEAFRVWSRDAAEQQGVAIVYEPSPDSINVEVEGFRDLDTSLKSLAAQKAQEVVEGMVEADRLIRQATAGRSFGADRYPDGAAPAARLVDTSQPNVVAIKPSRTDAAPKTTLGVRQRRPRPTDAAPLPED